MVFEGELIMNKLVAFGRTREEALTNLEKMMKRKHPETVFSRDEVKILKYGEKNTESDYMAEVIF